MNLSCPLQVKFLRKRFMLLVWLFNYTSIKICNQVFVGFIDSDGKVLETNSDICSDKHIYIKLRHSLLEFNDE